ncbi:MAG: LPS export ABC transporter permease LptG [Alphaproteobacteria bacterium BRH_c36]|nr:MAG: LPS export ABC transporter permease LptG [Alphaproteobacteria bacterium BRH_c36]
MKGATLNWYLGQKFLTSILGAFALCSILIFMIDFVELLRQASKYDDTGAVPAGLLFWMTLLRLPAYTEFLLAFAVQVGAIATLLFLSRKSELAVMRAGGMSAWQFLRPGLVIAFVLGTLATTVYNPIAAAAREQAEQLFADTFGQEGNLLRAKSGESWLRQNGIDGQSVLTAGHATGRGLKLTGVSALVYDPDGKFVARVDSHTAELKNGYWEMTDAWVVAPGIEPTKHKTYLLSTYLTPERVQDALGTVISLSFWDLPGLIEVAEKANISSSRLQIQYELLLSRPLLCIAMVLLAATVSLRSFRSGGIQTMVITGMLGGLGFFLLAEVSRQIGVAGLVPPWAAVWLPILLVILISLTVLLHQEDG